MIDGLLLLTELGLLLLLLRAIFRAERKKRDSDLGLFSYLRHKKMQEDKPKNRSGFRA